MSLARSLSAILTILCLVAVATVTVAQGPLPTEQEVFDVNLRATQTEAVAEEGNCASHQVIVANTGTAPIPQQHTISIRSSQPPAGWSYSPAPPSQVQVAAGQEQTIDFGLCPPDDANDGTIATVTLTATVDDDPRSPKASDQLTLSTRVTRESVFGLDVPDGYLYLTAAAAAAILVIILLTRRRSAPSISVNCPEPQKQVKAGRGTSFPVRISNDGRDKDVVSLSTSPVPRGWDTFLPLSDVPLEPREEQTVWLSVKSPDNAEPGDQIVVQVTARSANAGEARAVIDTVTTVSEGDGAPPKAPPTPAPAESSTASTWGRSTGSSQPLSTSSLSEETDEEETSVLGESSAKPVAVKRRKSSS